MPNVIFKRLTVEVPARLVSVVDSERTRLGFNSNVGAFKFFLCNGIQAQSTISFKETKDYSQKGIKLYLNLNEKIHNDIQDFRFKNRIKTKRIAALSLIEHGIDTYL